MQLGGVASVCVDELRTRLHSCSTFLFVIFYLQHFVKLSYEQS